MENIHCAKCNRKKYWWSGVSIVRGVFPVFIHCSLCELDYCFKCFIKHKDTKLKSYTKKKAKRKKKK